MAARHSALDRVLQRHDDILEYDGLLKENAPRFKKSRVVELMMALDPEVSGQGASEATEEEQASFAAIEPDVAEVVQPPAVAAELAEHKWDGKDPPAGWRRDDFLASDCSIRRSAWAPPWSLRPPTLEPEVWVGLSKKYKDLAREGWLRDDPAGYAAQQQRAAQRTRPESA